MLKPIQKKAAKFFAQEQGHTQKEIAELVGTSEMSISRWIRLPEFQAFVESEKSSLRRGKQGEYIQGQLDGLILSAIEAMDKILRDGSNEAARVKAAQYVLDRYAVDAAAPADDGKLQELTAALRLIHK